MLEALGGFYESARNKADVSAQIEELKAAANQTAEEIIDLIALFMVQTLLLPLLFAWDLRRPDTGQDGERQGPLRAGVARLLHQTRAIAVPVRVDGFRQVLLHKQLPGKLFKSLVEKGEDFEKVLGFKFTAFRMVGNCQFC